MQLKIIWISVGELQRRGSPTSFSFMNAESVAQSRNFDFENLSFTDPGFFTAGNLHNHLDAWRGISPSSEVISW